MITEGQAGPARKVPESSKASACYRNGGGFCICKGNGVLLRLAAAALGRCLCVKATKGTIFRRLLKGAWIVMRVGDLFWNIGLQYFRPRRPTFVRMTLRPEVVWNESVVDPIYRENGDALAHNVFAALTPLDL